MQELNTHNDARDELNDNVSFSRWKFHIEWRADQEEHQSNDHQKSGNAEGQRVAAWLSEAGNVRSKNRCYEHRDNASCGRERREISLGRLMEMHKR